MQLILTKNKLFSGILFFGLITSLLVLLDVQYFYLRPIFSFIFLTTIPGLLIMLMLRIRKIGFWEYLVYIIGLSITFMMFAGLAVNWILPWLHITGKPLSLNPILISFDILLLIFTVIAYKRNYDLEFNLKPLKFTWLDKIFIVIPAIFPALSVLGTFILNNNGPNYLTMVMLGGIAIYVFFVVLFRKRLNENIYPWSVLLISMSLLLMYSLRSRYIIGFDINQEFYVYKLAIDNSIWRMSSFKDAYNSCLSLNILPSVFYLFTKINPHYLFKLLYPIIFSFITVVIFRFTKYLSSKIIAFLSAFFFLSTSQFIQQMPTLARQEIAFLFYGLMLLVLFSKKIGPKIKNVLFLIFGFSMIVSHYSTSYLALALFTLTYFFIFLYRRWENVRIKMGRMVIGEKGEFSLTASSILLLLAFAFVWYSQVTDTMGGLINTMTQTSVNIVRMFKGDLKNEVSPELWRVKEIYTAEDIKEYNQYASEQYRINNPETNFYSSDEYLGFNPIPIYPRMIPLNNFQIIVVSQYMTNIFAKLIKVFMIIGVFYLLFFRFKKQSVNKEHIIMILVFLIFTGIILIAPYVSTEYNFERLNQQALIILSFPVILGGLLSLKFFKDNVRIIAIVLFMLTYFLSYARSGFLSQIIGGPALLTSNNFGEEYDRFYTHDQDVKSIEWLSENYDDRAESVFADRYARLKFFTFGENGKISIKEDILPSTIGRNSYVYMSYTNTLLKRIFKNYKNIVMSYSSPVEFLDQNKNKIYNNGGSEIFK